MAEIITLRAEARAGAGKGAARADAARRARSRHRLWRRQEPTPISVDPRELSRELAKRGFFATAASISRSTARCSAPCRARCSITRRPTRRCMSISCASAPTRRVTVTVPVVFVNQEQSPGIRRGGILNIVRHGIELVCPVDDIPDHLTVDLDGLDIGDSVHISAVTLPEGCRPTITGARFHDRLASRRRPAVREEARHRRRRRRPPPSEPAAGGLRPGGGGLWRSRRRAHASCRRARQSRLALRPQPPQYRLHGGRRDRPPPWVSGLSQSLQGRARRRRDRRRAPPAAEAADLHERIPARRSARRRGSTRSRPRRSS